MTIASTMDNRDGYLAGYLLVAAPALSDGCFDRSVIYLCEHNEHGALGVVVNHPIANIGLGEILKALNMGTHKMVNDLPVYFGGPVDAHRGFILHSTDKLLSDSVVGNTGIALTANASMLKEIAAGEGPEKGFLVLGYAGWAEGQLEAEIEQGGWITVPATAKLVFETENDMKWNLAAAALGVDMSRFSNVVGHA